MEMQEQWRSYQVDISTHITFMFSIDLSQLSAGAAMLHALDYIGNMYDLLLHDFTYDIQGILPKWHA